MGEAWVGDAGSVFNVVWSMPCVVDADGCIGSDKA